MSDMVVLDLGRSAITTAVTVGAPVLAASLLVGLTVAIFQSVTQIQEITLTFVPKILAVVVTGVVFGPWMLSVLLNHINNLFIQLPSLVR